MKRHHHPLFPPGEKYLLKDVHPGFLLGIIVKRWQYSWYPCNKMLTWLGKYFLSTNNTIFSNYLSSCNCKFCDSNSRASLWEKIENPVEVETHILCGVKTGRFNKWREGGNWMSTCKKMNLDLFLTLYTKIN